MMGHRERIKGSDEQDVFSGWRRVLCYTQRPGVTKAIKAKFSRRVRREAKADLDTKTAALLADESAAEIALEGANGQAGSIPAR